MSTIGNPLNRRQLFRGAAGIGVALGAAGRAFGGASKTPPTRVLGANDKIQLGVIGVGGRGAYLARVFAGIGQKTNDCQIVAVCDVWERRRREEAERHKCDGYLDYREVINRADIDGVVIATPDHWHAKIALEAMDKGKDVYLEKPMCHTLEEARRLVDTVKETQRVLQVGSQTTSFDQWHKAKKVIADGMIGPIIMSQGSYHRNSVEGEWNWTIDPNAKPDAKGDDYIDWKMWLGPASNRPFNADRYFRFRKYWDYSGGVATDLFYHVVAPMNICWGEPQTPHRVMAGGGVTVFKDGREVPDTFHLIAEFPKGHSLVLSSSMANSQHIPGLIRGHHGSLIMVDHGEFERYAAYITVRPERETISNEYKEKWGTVDIRIPVERTPEWTHMKNFLDCMRSREKPVLDVETAAKAQVTVTMSVLSYRQGRVLYFDEKNWKATDKPVKA